MKLNEEHLVRVKSCSRVFPAVPFARHTPQVGSSQSSHTSSAASGASGIKILAIFISNPKPPKQSLHRDFIVGTSTDTPYSRSSSASSPSRKRSREVEAEDDTDPLQRVTSRAPCVPSILPHCSSEFQRTASQGVASPHPSTSSRTVYVRVQYDKTLIETLPLALMRERHPQILIDYLLGSALWA